MLIQTGNGEAFRVMLFQFMGHSQGIQTTNLNPIHTPGWKTGGCMRTARTLTSKQTFNSFFYFLLLFSSSVKVALEMLSRDNICLHTYEEDSWK